MEFLAGYHYKARLAPSSLPPLVLLHGSGGTEKDLAGFGEAVRIDQSIYLVRGGIIWENGFAFFRRNADRSLDYDDLATQTAELAQFLKALSERHAFERPPVLIGYSNGAIIAASLIARHQALTSGAVLLRPLSPFRDTLPDMPKACPLLILAARNDRRRDLRDHEIVASQFTSSGVDVTHRLLDCGHEISGEDAIETRTWLQGKFL